MENNYLARYVQKFFSAELPVKQVLFNIIVVTAFLGGLVSLCASMFSGRPMLRNGIAAVLLVIVAVGFYQANFKDNLDKTVLWFVPLIALVFFPAMYITGGGVSSGMPLWLALGLVFTSVLLEGKRMKNLLVAEVLIYSALILINYFIPTLAPRFTTRGSMYLDIWQSIVTVAAVVGLVIKVQTRLYRDAMERYDERNRSFQHSKDEAEAARAAAMAANQAKSRFLANMSHEIRTPINAVLGMDELILRQTQDKEIEQYALNLRDAGQSLLNLINDILDFSKLESGKMEIVSSDYELASILHDTVNIIEPRLQKKDLAFTLTNDHSLPARLYGDNVRIEQILINILTNAVKYTRQGSVALSINYERLDTERIILVLSVKDTGIGITEENKKKLFDSFQRLEEKKNRSIEGTGLGLSIVKQLIDLMGGRIEVESVYGEGSTFTVYIPQKVVDWQPIGDVMKDFSKIQKENDRYKKRFTAPQARVLIVDDLPMNLLFAKKLLKAIEIEADTAQSGRECLNLLQRKRYHVIFMDHMMPEMDGIETLRQMKTLVGNRNVGVPVVMLTANAVSGVRDEYLSLGFSEYLSKPMRGVDLENMILKFLPPGIVHFIEEEKTEEAVETVVPIPMAQEVAIPDTVPEALHPLCRMVPSLDATSGLAYCMGDVDFYREMLTDYASNGRLEEIEKFYAAKDWDNYRIQVHALKSTSLTLGNTPLSEAAKSLEYAVKEDNIPFIEENHERIINHDYRDFLTKIDAFLNGVELNADTAGKETAENSGEKKKKTVLIADAGEKVRSGVKSALENDYNIGEAENAKAIFDFIDTNLPDVILLSASLPGNMDGFMVMEQLRLDSVWQNIPVIFLTDGTNSEVELRAIKMGAMDFIRKPLVDGIVRQRIKNVIEINTLKNSMEEKVCSVTNSYSEKSEFAQNLAREVIETLAAVIDSSDNYLEGHSFRVASCCHEIARRLGRPEIEQQELYYMGLIYDIGKSAIGRSILQKPSRLTEEEISVVQRHTVLGEEMLKKITLQPEFAQAARWHHERYDGMGYPDGLKGEKIPLFARILAAADAYDAMKSQRAYRRALPLSDIAAEFQKESGRQFDPDIGKIILDIIRENPDYSEQQTA